MAEETRQAPPVRENREQHFPKVGEKVSMRQLLEAGVHFGHQTRRWNPKMKKFIFTARNDIHVIDLQQTVKKIDEALTFIKSVVAKNGSVLFVGTKKQAQQAIEEEAKRCKMPYVSQRWLGGTLTNNMTIRKSINKLRFFEADKAKGVFDKLSKKEASRRNKTLTRLHFYLSGIKDMGKLPEVMFVIDTKKEQLAIHEANKLGIPIVGLVDTNADPTEVQYPIPGNDDAIRAIKLICTIVANSVIEGSQAAVSNPNAASREDNAPAKAPELVDAQ